LVEDTARLMQGFVPERSFTKDRRVIDMRIDSVLMVCGTPDQCRRLKFLHYLQQTLLGTSNRKRH